MPRNPSIEFSVDDKIMDDFSGYFLAKTLYQQNGTLLPEGVKVENNLEIQQVLDMPEDQLKIIFYELIKKFAAPTNGGGSGRKFNFDL